jgi:hypothetical protein
MDQQKDYSLAGCAADRSMMMTKCAELAGPEAEHRNQLMTEMGALAEQHPSERVILAALALANSYALVANAEIVDEHHTLANPETFDQRRLALQRVVYRAFKDAWDVVEAYPRPKS